MEAEVRLPRQGHLPHPVLVQGPGTSLKESAFCVGCERNLSPAPFSTASLPADGPRSRTSVLRCLEVRVPGRTSPCHPCPLLRREPRLRRAAGLAGVAGKARPWRRPAPPPSPAPGRGSGPTVCPAHHPLAPIRTPRALQLPCAPGFEPFLQGASSGRDCEPGWSGQATGAGKTRAGGLRSRIGEEGRDRPRSLSCPRGGGENPA